MPVPFEGFDLSEFWLDTPYARGAYEDLPLTDEMVADVEATLGFRLPARYALLGELGSTFMQTEWGYPTFGIFIADCPSAGHDMVMLDYRACGPTGEPEAVQVDQESDYAVTFLAKDFESFIRLLVDEAVFSHAEEILEEARVSVARGSFSPRLAELLAAPERAAYAAWLRVLASELVESGLSRTGMTPAKRPARSRASLGAGCSFAQRSWRASRRRGSARGNASGPVLAGLDERSRLGDYFAI